jgi:hypothetical protein
LTGNDTGVSFSLVSAGRFGKEYPMWQRSETFAEDRRRDRERANHNELMVRDGHDAELTLRASRIEAWHAAVAAWRTARPVRPQLRIIRE